MGSSNVNVLHSVFNVIGGNQTTVTNVYPPETRRLFSPPRPINDAPVGRLSAHFTGREKDLHRLDEMLNRTQDGNPRCCIVHGMPGVGKSQLSLCYAVKSFDTGRYTYIFWTSATSVDKLTQGFSKVLDLVCHPDRDVQDQSMKLTTARLWLEECSVNWLFVIDNVDKSTLDFLRMHFPRRGNVIFTTRAIDVAEALINITRTPNSILKLQTLDVDDTINLLFDDAGIGSETITPSLLREAEQLVGCVGRLPLAVVQAASFMKQTHTTLNEMLKLYKSEAKMEAIRWESDLTLHEERSVAATFSRQFEQLVGESRDVGNLLKVLSFFDPENIPVGMIVKGAEEWLRLQDERYHSPNGMSHVSSPFPLRPQHESSQSKFSTMLHKVQKMKWNRRRGRQDRTEPLADDSNKAPAEFYSLITLITSPIKFQTALQRLQNLSLIERRSDSGTSSLWMHDLIGFMMQDAARNAESYQEWLQSSVSLICGAFELIGDVALPQSWEECETYISHLRSLDKKWGDAHGLNVELTRANVRIATYMESRGRYDEAGAVLQRTLSSREKHLGADHLDTLLSMNGLAHVYWLQGRYDDASVLHQRALAGREKHLGADHPDTLTSVNNLAIVYGSQGRYDDAEALFQRALVGSEKHLGTDHHDTLTSVNELANVYQSQGRYDEAEVLYRRALVGSEKYLGSNHPDTLISVGNLALVYRLQGWDGEAEPLFQRALEGFEKQLGADHPLTLTSVNNLAIVYDSQGRYDDAEVFYRRASAGYEKHLGADHPNTLTSLNNLANVYRLQGRCDEAETLFQRAIAGREKCLTADHPSTLDSIHDLASLYEYQGRRDEAEALRARVSAVEQK